MQNDLDILRVLRDKQIVENLCQQGSYICPDGKDCRCLLKNADSGDLFKILKNYDDAVDRLISTTN